MGAKKWGQPKQEGNGALWQYYIAKKFAFVPVYIQGQFVWLRMYWETWPEVNGKVIEMYREQFTSYPGNG